MTFAWYIERRFSFLLLAIVLLFVLHSLLGGLSLGRWLYDILATGVFLATFPLLFKRKGYRVAAVLLGVPTLIANWTGYAFPGLPERGLAVTFHLLAALFLSLSVVVILQSVHESRAITWDALAGAFGGYLLAGAVFGHLCTAVEWITPGSFHVAPELAAELGHSHPQHMLFNYFSFVTLTTVGYGDVTPVTQPARTLASLDAVVGQFYIAVVMAELIGLRVSQPRGGKPSGAGPS